jgi:hypothetical protein
MKQEPVPVFAPVFVWKEWIDETTKGFKDELKRAGRIVELG